jgi:hypothetical protein
MDIETFERANILIMQYLSSQRSRDDWVRWCEEGKKLCVWEADDDIWEVTNHPAHGEAYEDPEAVRRMEEMIVASHLVTVTTEALAERYRRFNPHVVVLPNSIPEWMVEWAFSPDPPFTIGYTGGASHLNDFASIISPVLARWMRRNPSTRIRLFGHDRRPEGAPFIWPVTVTPWQRETRKYQESLAGTMSVGIAPLLDTPFNRGKSPIKALEYAALRIPCIASDHPVYRPVITPDTGFLCRTTTDWINALTITKNAPQRILEIQDAAFQNVLDYHLQPDTIHQWLAAYHEAANRIGVTLS